MSVYYEYDLDDSDHELSRYLPSTYYDDAYGNHGENRSSTPDTDKSASVGNVSPRKTKKKFGTLTYL